MESEWRSCPPRCHRPKPPLSQGFGALAAPERDGPTATSERVPRCRPVNRGNKVVSWVQLTGRILHTWRTGTGAVTGAHRCPRTWSVPQLRQCTCSRGAGTSRGIRQRAGRWLFIRPLPGVRAGAVHALPHRQARRGALQPPMVAPITSLIGPPALACGRLRALLPDAETGTGGPSPCAWATSDAFPILTEATHFNSVQDVTTRRPAESGRPLNRTAFFPPRRLRRRNRDGIIRPLCGWMRCDADDVSPV